MSRSSFGVAAIYEPKLRPVFGNGILTVFPFGAGGLIEASWIKNKKFLSNKHALALNTVWMLLRTDLPCKHCASAGTFFHFDPQAFLLSICYFYQDLH